MAGRDGLSNVWQQTEADVEAMRAHVQAVRRGTADGSHSTKGAPRPVAPHCHPSRSQLTHVAVTHGLPSAFLGDIGRQQRGR